MDSCAAERRKTCLAQEGSSLCLGKKRENAMSERVVMLETAAEPGLTDSSAAGRDDLFPSHDSSFYLKTENCFIYDALLLEELTVVPKGDSFLGLSLRSMEI